MTIKVLIYLSLVAIVRTSQYSEDYDSPTAYSSVYTSFDSHITEDADDTFEEAKTNSPILDQVTQSGFINEAGAGQFNYNNGGTQEKSKASTEGNNNIAQIKVVQSSTTLPSQPKSNVAQMVSAQQSTTSNIKSTTNPPLSSAIIGEGRLITPGLSAFASSAEAIDNGPAKITVAESATTKTSPSSKEASSNASKSENNSQTVTTSDSNIPKDSVYTDSDSNESFDDFGRGYSW